MIFDSLYENNFGLVSNHSLTYVLSEVKWSSIGKLGLLGDSIIKYSCNNAFNKLEFIILSFKVLFLSCYNFVL